jgi:RNA polymerase sigma-70 factor, ECF subfamily
VVPAIRGRLTAQVSEQELLARALGGERPAFEALAGPCLPSGRALAARLLGSPEDADDALQESLLKAWRGLAGVRPEVPFRAFFLRVVFNQCADQRRRRATRRRHELAVRPAPERAASDRSAQRETLAKVAAAIAQLPARQQAALHLRVFEELDYRTIGAVLGITERSARIYVVRARSVLRERLAAELEGP